MAARLTASAKVRRDDQIVADRARGYGWAMIADRYGISGRQARSIWTEHWAREPDLSESDPLLALREALAGFDAVIEDAAVLGETAAQDAVRLGCLKARLAAMMAKFDLMETCGLLPADAGLLRHEIDVRDVVRVVMAAFDSYAVPREAREAIVVALGEASTRRNGEQRARPDRKLSFHA